MDIGDKLLLVAERGNERLEIIEGRGGEGFYIYRFVDGESMNDYFGPTIDGLRETAYVEWQVHDSTWRLPYAGEGAMCHLCQ
jgi:hypothetical protein